MARRRADYEPAIRQSVNLRRAGSSFGLVVAGLDSVFPLVPEPIRSTLHGSVAAYPVLPKPAGGRCNTSPPIKANEDLLREMTYEHQA